MTVSATTRTNWAGNVTYRASGLARPTSVDELQQLVASTPRLTALGSRHSFNTIADTDALQVSLADLPPVLDIDEDRRVVRVAAGMIHSQVAAGLEARGWALANLASLPHISTAGAVATGTHGSGVRNPSLAQAVVGLEVVRASGDLAFVDASTPGGALDAHRVALGALGVVTAVELAIEPTFQVATTVHLDLPWDAVAAHFDEVVSDAYSVSLFTSFDDRGARQVWVKHRVGEPAPAVDLVTLGARPADGPVHPGENDPAGVTEQGGVPGPWSERLPHFRSSFTPVDRGRDPGGVPAAGRFRGRRTAGAPAPGVAVRADPHRDRGPDDRRRHRVARAVLGAAVGRHPLHVPAGRERGGSRGGADRGGPRAVRRPPALGEGVGGECRAAARGVPAAVRLRRARP
ncbi:FAD/FMN-containing dehydrogenase [Curtobacterium sp. SORGH_AS776]|nr:FAD/FMN-containing dehydrogenase [Curtobacterium sp. SORGH_AS_0776]